MFPRHGLDVRTTDYESHKMPTDIEGVRRSFENDRFAAANGIELVDLGPGFAKARLAVTQQHWNCFGLTHGGAIFTLAAFTFAAAGNTGGRLALGVNMHLSCLKPTHAGTLYAEATEVSRSNRISTCTVRVTDEMGELVAMFQGTAYIKDEPFPPNAG